MPGLMKAPTPVPTDADIVKKVLSGDVNAFETLLERHEAHVFTVTRRHVPPCEVAGVAQDVFVRAFQGLSGFRDKSGFKAWLSAIAVRACFDFWRKRYRNREVPTSQLSEEHREWLEQAVSGQADAAFDENARQSELLKILDWAMDRLSAAERMVMELVYLEGLSHREAGDLLGLSAANVKIRVFRARRKLQRLFADAGLAMKETLS